MAHRSSNCSERALRRAALFGNVVYADGVLVVVTPTEVWGYVSEAGQFGFRASER